MSPSIFVKTCSPFHRHVFPISFCKSLFIEFFLFIRKGHGNFIRHCDTRQPGVWQQDMLQTEGVNSANECAHARRITFPVSALARTSTHPFRGHASAMPWMVVRKYPMWFYSILR